MGEHNEEIARLKEQIESLERLRGVLDVEFVAAKISELNLQLDQLIQTHGGAYIAGEVRTGGGDFIGRDQINILLRDSTNRFVQSLLKHLTPHLSESALHDATKAVVFEAALPGRYG